MLLQEWLMMCIILGSATAMRHQTMDKPLRSALEATARNQRYLNANSQEYLNDRMLKYAGPEGERKYDRERPGEREMEEEDEELNFLPNEAGQLETVENVFQDMNNQLLEKALINYLDAIDAIPQQVQEEPVTSLFRERERSSSRKRGSGSERLNMDDKDLQDGSPYNLGDVDDEGYIDARQMLYDRYRVDQGNKLYENPGPMSWGELLNKESMIRGQGREADESEYGDREQDPNLLYLSMLDRRNVNGGYPMARHYPVSKRSPKPLPIKKQVTDPKVAQDLGALFGTQTTDNQNHTHGHDHDHDHDHSHDKDHDHGRDHGHDHDHGDQRKHESSSEPPKVTPPPKGQKENATKLGKSKSIEVRKKSVDWSQYFGIDRRRKKATFTAGPGTQNQDDEWILQRYYENMVQNLKANNRNCDEEVDEKKDDHLASVKKTMKKLLLEEFFKSAHSKNGIDWQKVKDNVMSRLALAHSYEKMLKSLNDFNVAVQKAIYTQANQSSNFRENSNAPKSKDKRTNNNLIDAEGTEENRACPEMEVIEKRCRSVDILAGDESQMLYLPCVMLQICKACVQDDLEEECLNNYALETGKICDAQEIREGPKGREACASTALMLSQLETPAIISDQCRIDGNDSCLWRRYHYRYRLRYPHFL